MNDKTKGILKLVGIIIVVVVLIIVGINVFKKIKSGNLVKKLEAKGYQNVYGNKYELIVDGSSNAEYNDDESNLKSSETYYADLDNKLYGYINISKEENVEMETNVLYNITDKTVTAYYSSDESGDTLSFIKSKYDIKNESYNCENVIGEKSRTVCDNLKDKSNELVEMYKNL